MAFPSFPNGTRFSANVIVTWYPPLNVYGAVGCDAGEIVTVYDDDPDSVYDDVGVDDHWALVTKKENGQTGYFPDYYLADFKAINPAKVASKPNPKPGQGAPKNKPVKVTTNHPKNGKTKGGGGGKPVNMEKHAPPGKAKKASGGGCCGGSKKSTGKAGKARALELAEEDSDFTDDDDDDLEELQATKDIDDDDTDEE